MAGKQYRVAALLQAAYDDMYSRTNMLKRNNRFSETEKKSSAYSKQPFSKLSSVIQALCLSTYISLYLLL